MPPTALQLADDLRTSFRGRLLTDERTRLLYATDASLFRIEPLAIALPQDEADLCTLVNYANEQALPLIPRGAGTGLAGESLGPGVIVDLSKNFRQILEINSATATVEPGVTVAELQSALKPYGLRFAPDPANGTSATLGGMVATNASGGHAFRHGTTRDHVLGLNVVWNTGESAALGKLPHLNETVRTKEIRTAIEGVLQSASSTIAAHPPRTLTDRCGYRLWNTITPAGLDFVSLLCGSEGTLAATTAITVRTIPLAGGTAFAIVGFTEWNQAIQAALILRTADGIVGADLLDRRLLSRARLDGVGVPSDLEAALVLTFEAETEREALRCGWDAVQGVQSLVQAGVLVEPTVEPTGIARAKAFRATAVAGLYALGPGQRPQAFCEDVAVPTDALPEFLAGIQTLGRKFEFSTSILSHTLIGVVHVRPLIDVENPTDREKLYPVADAVHALALSLGGTITAQHGTGLARSPWVEKQVPELMNLYREVKRIFDPKGIWNPGKIVGLDPSRPAWPLRPALVLPRKPLAIYTAEAAVQEVAKCNGCGDCRPRSGSYRMCPVFKATGDEAATPRAKANLLRDVLASDKGLSQDDVKAVADLCVDCRACASECRAGVDIPRLMLEAKAAHVADHGFTRTQWFLARAESLLGLAGNFAITTNRFINTKPGRWLLERILGVSRSRTLPEFTHWSLIRRARRMGYTRKPRLHRGPTPKGLIAFYADPFTNWVDPSVGLAALAIFRHHGYAVFVPARVKPTGAAALAQGDIETAREYATRNVKRLAELVREGYRVVTTDPTAALAFTQDYPRLLADEPDRKQDAELLAGNVIEFTQLLNEWQKAGELKPLTQALPVTLGHHVPCHLKAITPQAAGPGLLEQIPGLKVRPLEESCSGMAGVWGMAAKHAADSVKAGEVMLNSFDAPGILYGVTECGPCRMQMQEVGRKRTFHPAQYLAYGYGLMPELENKLMAAVPL